MLLNHRIALIELFLCFLEKAWVFNELVVTVVGLELLNLVANVHQVVDPDDVFHEVL